MLLPFLTVFDFLTIRANFVHPIKLKNTKTFHFDFALLVPIFNDVKYLTNIGFLEKYGRKVVLCTTTSETPQFMHNLKELSNRYGFRIRRCNVRGDKKNPWAIYNKTLLAHDAVLKHTIADLKEEYVIFLDGDTFVEEPLEKLAGTMEEKNYDIASVKIMPSKRQTIMENLQGVEYDIAMQARLIYPWLTSGAGMVAKRKVMIDIMKNHSLFFNGGDVEIGKLADMMGYKIGHIPMVFFTEIPSTFMGWVKQRFSWMCGMFRHSIINIDHNLKHPFHFIYFSFIIYFLMPFKLIEMLASPHLIPIILFLYVVITYFANWKVRSRWMILFPFYALFQVLVIVWFGIYRYIKTVIRSHNFGKIKMHYNPKQIKFWSPMHALQITKNYALIGIIIFVICSTNVGIFQKIVFGRDYEPLELAQVVASNLHQQVQEIGSDLALEQDGWIASDNQSSQVLGVSTEFVEE